MLLVLAFLALALCFETEYDVPPVARQPLYSVIKSPEPIALPKDSQIINLNYRGIPLECVVPPAQADETPLKPLQNEQAVNAARNALKPLENVTSVHLDDIWAWSVNFNRSVVQFMPLVNADYTKFRFAGEKSFASTGVNAANLSVFENAEPAVVHDQHALKIVLNDGDWCEVSRDYRKSNIYFICDPSAEEGKPKLQSVWEPHVCIYEMLWGSKELCSVSQFKLPQVDRNIITCGPEMGLDVEMYHIYNEILESEREELEREPLSTRDMAFVGNYPVAGI